MEDRITDIKCGEKTYTLSNNGSTVYYNSKGNTGGTTVKRIEFKNNIFINTSDGSKASEFDICNAISNS